MTGKRKVNRVWFYIMKGKEMKIYNKIVISIESGDILFEDCFEYIGEISECKGGSTTTNTQDPAYNARMATIAEQQQGMAQEYFNYWKQNQAPLETAQAQSALSLLPSQTELTRQQIQSQTSLLPAQTNTAQAYYGKVLSGVNTEDQMAKAKTDVQIASSQTEGERRREFARMGVDPSSPAFAATRSADLRAKAAAMAGAGTNARRYAENLQMQRLTQAVGTL
jgi:hypothetical protein